MKKRERGALSFRVRKVTSLFLAGLLCFSMPAMAYAAETNGEEQAEAQPSEAVMGDKPVDGDALAIGTEEADAAEFGGAVSVRPEIQSEDAGAENAAGGAEDSDDVVPDERERSLLAEGSSFRYEYADGSFAVDAWVIVDGARYYFGADGLAVAGRQKIEGIWYFFDDECRMQTGWVTWKNGTKSFFDWDGRALTGWRSFNGVKYYFDPSTAMSLRWSQKLDGRWYYFDSASRMTKGIVTWKDGTKSYYDSRGRETGGWVQSDGAWYYFDWSDGKAVRWHQKIDGHWYYFDSDYQMHTGWLKWDGVQKWSYFYSNGQQAFGTQIIGGYRYVFDSNGETSTTPDTQPAGQLDMWNKAQNYYSNTNYIILVNSRTHKVGVFRGSSYNWEPVWYWDCTTGAPSSPTVKGTFTVGSRGKSFGSGYTCWYWTQFYGNYLFHSVLYQPGSMSHIQDGRLGISASHGCVRLDIECARWIYNNIPRGTRVVSY